MRARGAGGRRKCPDRDRDDAGPGGAGHRAGRVAGADRRSAPHRRGVDGLHRPRLKRCRLAAIGVSSPQRETRELRSKADGGRRCSAYSARHSCGRDRRAGAHRSGQCRPARPARRHLRRDQGPVRDDPGGRRRGPSGGLHPGRAGRLPRAGRPRAPALAATTQTTATSAACWCTRRTLTIRGMRPQRRRDRRHAAAHRPGVLAATRASRTTAPRRPTGPIVGRNGIVVYEASNVSVENLTVCNFLQGSGDSGNQIWWNGGDRTGKINHRARSTART